MVFRASLTEPPLGPFLQHYYKQSIPPGLYQLDECSRCELIFQRFVGTDAFLAELYGQWLDQQIDDHYRTCLKDYRASRDGHELMALAAHLGKRRLTVLDYGAGWGLWPIIAGKLGHRAYAVEIAQEKAEWMAENGVTILGDEDLSRHSFDVINLEQTLEHLTEPLSVIEQLTPSLDGVLKIAVPNAACVDISAFRRGDLRQLPVLLPFEHVNGFTSLSLDRVAQEAGLREVRPSLIQRYAFLPHLPRSSKEAIKEFVRPLVAWRSRMNLYRWFARKR